MSDKKKKDRQEHCKCKLEDTQQHGYHKTYKANLGEFIESITKMENSLANILQSQSNLIYKNSDKFTPEQILELNKGLENTLKLAIKKEMLLEFLLEEVKDSFKEYNHNEK